MDGQEVQQMMEVDTPTWVFTSFLFPLCLQSDDSRDGVGRNFGSEEKNMGEGIPKKSRHSLTLIT